MAAYLIVETDITDAARYETCKTLAASAIAKHGGRHLSRGGAIERVEGDWDPKRLAPIEFPSAERARVFHASPDHRRARASREGAARMRIVMLEST